jgi:SAM-dependent methyltransferase
MDDSNTDERHSQDWFGDARDHWWNRDFLALIAHRWDLREASRVLDVGCGIGHWGRALMPHLPLTTTLAGVDREPAWIEEATARARVFGLEGRTSYLVGTAEALPFDDASFDLVTCQTVIMHLADPRAGLAEMLRVLKPGGRILCAEPNNLASDVARFDPNDPVFSPADMVAIFELELLSYRGKRALGEGDNTVGEKLPGLFAELGLDAISVYTADRAFSFVPPYLSEAEKAGIDAWRDIVERRLWLGDEAKCRRFYLAGGGHEDDFPERWDLLMRFFQRSFRELEAGRHASAGGSLFYLISARKPR